MSKAPVTELGKFGAKMEELFTVLKKAFPGDVDLEKYHDKLAMARKVNPRMVCGGFMDVVKMSTNPSDPAADLYLHRIMMGDDTFFVALDLSQIVDPNYHGLIEKITNLWISMSEASQTAIKRYLQILVTRGAIAMKDTQSITILNQFRAAKGASLLKV